MRFFYTISIFFLMMVSATFIVADAPVETKTLMADKGKVLLTDSFSKELSADWKPVKGTWAIVDGALKGVEKTEDMHAAVVRRDLKTHDIVAQYSFRFDGGKMTAFSLNDSKGHVCRVTINAAGFSVNRDKPNAKSTEKGAVLDKVAMPFKPGQWYTIVIELCGKNFVASVDDSHIAIGSHDEIDIDKTTLAFPVAGDGVSIKDLTIWEATVKKDWDMTKTKLKDAKAKTVAK